MATKVICPYCKKEYNTLVEACVPDEQKISITIKTESENISADTLGSFLVNMTKVYKAVAKDLGTKIVVFVKDIQMKPSQTTIDLYLVGAKKKVQIVPRKRIKEKP